jgi:hypothetical protein
VGPRSDVLSGPNVAETEDGGITGDMEVVPAEEVEVIGPVPRLSPGCGPLAW